MKTNKLFLVTVLCLAVTSMVFTSCEKDDNDALIGTWIFISVSGIDSKSGDVIDSDDYDDEDSGFIFKKNDICQFFIEDETVSGTYKYKDGIITFDWEVEVGLYKVKVKELTSTQLVLEEYVDDDSDYSILTLRKK